MLRSYLNRIGRYCLFLSRVNKEICCFSPKASRSNFGSALFSPRSRLLRLLAEMPCSKAALTREKFGLNYRILFLDAHTAACVRSFTPSLLKIWTTWLFTVWGLMESFSEISVLVLPSATRRRTSTSLWVKSA